MVPALYRLTAALLITHEIDSGYWREWEVLRLPGGVAAFLAVHVPLAVAVLWGAERLAVGGRAGRALAAAVGCAGLLAVGVHGVLLWRGGAAFSTAPSLVLLALVGASAAGLLLALARTPRRRRSLGALS
jgi:hypothetical protein